MKSKEEILQEQITNFLTGEYNPLSAISDSQDLILEAMELYAAQSKWVDCNDGLPTDEFWYRVLIDGKHDILPYSCLDGEWWSYGESHPTTNNVTHYQSFEDLPPTP